MFNIKLSSWVILHRLRRGTTFHQADTRLYKHLPWALYIRLVDGWETVLPVSLLVTGPSSKLSLGDIQQGEWSLESLVQEMFNPYPILDTSDVEAFSIHTINSNAF